MVSRSEPGYLAAADAIASTYQCRGGQPGLVYGIVAGGSLVHCRGFGQRWLDGPAPDADTIFRIASMTKSFTAAAILALRDDGALALDDAVADHVPELRGLRPATADSPPVSVRHLLTMTAGLPTDDPWGDRQQGLPLADFARLLTGGVSFAWAPGTRFEYSNLGYAILGRVISEASGSAYSDFIAERLLVPLGLSRTGFEIAGFDPANLARGYQRSGTGWSELVPDGYGAFAPMGGIFSCVSDLARWVSGFAGAFPPGAETAGGAHPLCRASRREMQMPQIALPQGPSRLPGDRSDRGPVSYGFGLFAAERSSGRIVQHSGGYPGFGSHMRWHPATGIGVIVLANSTYASTQPLASRLLDAMLREPSRHELSVREPSRREPSVRAEGADVQPLVCGPAPDPGGPWPTTLSAQRAVMALLRSWDDAAAERLFTENVALDEPFQERRRKVALIRERIGDFRADEQRAAEFDSPAHCRWWLRGERGVAAAEILLTPQRVPRVQFLGLAVPPDDSAPLGRVLQAVVSLLNEGARDWPLSLAASDALDTRLLLRQLQMAAAWAGHCQPGAFRAGNGATSVTVELDGETGRLILTVLVDPAEGGLVQVEITLDT